MTGKAERMLARLGIGVVLAVAVAMTGPAPAWAADGAPYADPAVAGALGFCDGHGRSVTGGRLDAVPFVARIVSTFRPPAPYDGLGRAAFIEAYQPRQGLTPGEWSGELLTSSTSYSDPAHPAAVGTAGDINLRQFAEDFPPSWDGLVQLRMYYTVPGHPTYAVRYAAADLRIGADTWTVVRGGGVPCSDGRAVSVAGMLAPAAAAGKIAPGSFAIGRDQRTLHSGRAASAPGSAAMRATGDGSANVAVGSAAGDGDGGFPTFLVVLGAVVGAGAVVMFRRRLFFPHRSLSNERHPRG